MVRAEQVLCSSQPIRLTRIDCEWNFPEFLFLFLVQKYFFLSTTILLHGEWNPNRIKKKCPQGTFFYFEGGECSMGRFWYLYLWILDYILILRAENLIICFLFFLSSSSFCLSRERGPRRFHSHGNRYISSWNLIISRKLSFASFLSSYQLD